MDDIEDVHLKNLHSLMVAFSSELMAKTFEFITENEDKLKNDIMVFMQSLSVLYFKKIIVFVDQFTYIENDYSNKELESFFEKQRKALAESFAVAIQIIEHEVNEFSKDRNFQEEIRNAFFKVNDKEIH